MLELIPIRKIMENSQISFFNLTQFPDTAGIYLYFPYYFMLALIAKISFLPLEVVYVKMRAVYAALSLLGFYGLSLRLFEDKAQAQWSTLVLGLLIAINPGPWEWPASLFPLCRRGAFTMGVLTPLGAWLALVLGRRPVHWGAMVLAMLFFYLLAQLLSSPGPHRRASLLVLCSFLAGALLFRTTQAQLHLAANEMEGQARSGLLHQVGHLMSSPVQALFGGVPPEGRYVISNTGSMTPYSF